MIDDDTLKRLLRIDDDLMQLCKWLNEKRDIEISSRFMPLVDDLTHILPREGELDLDKVGRSQVLNASLNGIKRAISPIIGVRH
jgi:hypothetical protein